MNGIEDPEVYRRMHHEMMRNMVWKHKNPNMMTSRLLTRAETHVLQHEMLNMSQILGTLAPTRMHEGWLGHETDHLNQMRANLKELNINISYMENEEFAEIKDHAGLRELAARNLKQAHAFAYELKHILTETEEIERDLSAIPGSHEKAKSRFRWEDGLLHRELQGVIDNISNLVYALLPGYMR
jgi:hypothetical protein